jgi:hypothetical protein
VPRGPANRSSAIASKRGRAPRAAAPIESITSATATSTRGSSIARSVSGASGPRHQATTAGSSSATRTAAVRGSASSAARSV